MRRAGSANRPLPPMGRRWNTSKRRSGRSSSGTAAPAIRPRRTRRAISASTTATGLLVGGKGGPAVIPGDPEKGHAPASHHPDRREAPDATRRRTPLARRGGRVDEVDQGRGRLARRQGAHFARQIEGGLRALEEGTLGMAAPRPRCRARRQRRPPGRRATSTASCWRSWIRPTSSRSPTRGRPN